MKKMLIMLMLALAVFATGCGSEDAGSTTEEVKNTIDEAENTTDDVENVTDEAKNTTDEAENTTDEVENTTDEVENTTDEVENATEDQTTEAEKDSEKWESYMASIKEQAAALKNSLENDELTQLDMNDKSQELYDLWDGALNTLWKELKATCSEDDFAKLLEEQRAWVAEKETAVEKAGQEVMGGSMYPLVVNTVAAQYTEERVYELYELLKNK